MDDIPDDPDLPGIPDIPSIPNIPNIPDIPDIPDIPSIQNTYNTYHINNIPSQQSKPQSTGVQAATSASPMPPVSMVLGVDSLIASGEALLSNAQSQDYLGSVPQFWGRYFYAPGQMNSSGKKDSHYSAQENALLRAKTIRVLPVARQTSNVGSPTKAKKDATQNVAALFEVFPAQYLSGADPDVLVFLDTEPETPLDAGYFTTWSATIISEANRISNGRVRFHPAIYGNHSDDATWTALKQAMDNGAVCDGIWVARYYYPTPVPKPWNDALTTPNVALHCPLLAWQYWESPKNAPETSNFDTSLVNTPHMDMLMNRLVMPPPS